MACADPGPDRQGHGQRSPLPKFIHTGTEAMTALIDDAKNVPHSLSLTENDEGMPVFGFSFNGVCVHEPLLSDCGRLTMTPRDRGLTEEQAN